MVKNLNSELWPKYYFNPQTVESFDSVPLKPVEVNIFNFPY